MLFDLAAAGGLEQKRAAMAAGQHINSTENRAVMHVALRAPKGKQIMVDGADVVPEVHAVLDKIADFAERVRNGTWVGATGKKLTTVVAIGIGGSCKQKLYMSIFVSLSMYYCGYLIQFILILRLQYAIYFAPLWDLYTFILRYIIHVIIYILSRYIYIIYVN